MIFLDTSSLENHEFEVSKYEIFSKCSTHGYYILRKSCVLKPRIRGSFRDLKVSKKVRKSQDYAIRCPRDSTRPGITRIFIHSMLSRRSRICPTRPSNFLRFPGDLRMLENLNQNINEQNLWTLTRYTLTFQNTRFSQNVVPMGTTLWEKSCILKPRIRGSFRDLKVSKEDRKKSGIRG